ncbi:hypothetical protein J6590_005841 [Homalodisca vitripennis]|nr:hypothetical protein J6590_005841 [Homalodisca vitripennis]
MSSRHCYTGVAFGKIMRSKVFTYLKVPDDRTMAEPVQRRGRVASLSLAATNATVELGNRGDELCIIRAIDAGKELNNSTAATAAAAVVTMGTDLGLTLLQKTPSDKRLKDGLEIRKWILVWRSLISSQK